ncbi:DinB family protein [Pedobacter metabolipauper]|uniref:DinB family protein n=1 Tax=Pedobacter metabolipauper TaxID=425513 RepID=A0A4R6SW65_9SPHI|nr:DinB family protein [Pedobacter metabolipauper]TDQ09619.1 DinB family protein [Pedobacter metabolipauper]
MNRPQTNEYPAWGETYIKLIDLIDGDILDLLERQATEFAEFINSLTEKGDYAYAPGKWTLKELIGHIIDTERILVYRLTCFARAEEQELPGFEEDDYVAAAHFSERSMYSFSEEFALLRKANLYLFRSLKEEELDRSGIASGRKISVRALVFVIAGHLIHHTQIIKERYL